MLLLNSLKDDEDFLEALFAQENLVNKINHIAKKHFKDSIEKELIGVKYMDGPHKEEFLSNLNFIIVFNQQGKEKCYINVANSNCLNGKLEIEIYHLFKEFASKLQNYMNNFYIVTKK